MSMHNYGFARKLLSRFSEFGSKISLCQVLIRIPPPYAKALLLVMSPASRFKRALVTPLLEFARVYGLTLNLHRDSEDDLIKG